MSSNILHTKGTFSSKNLSVNIEPGFSILPVPSTPLLNRPLDQRKQKKLNKQQRVQSAKLNTPEAGQTATLIIIWNNAI